MEMPRLSVVVASYGRPSALCRCLTALHQMPPTGVEIVVVADAEGLAAIARLGFADRLKTREQVSPNISRARNAGLELAAGDLVAFIDDDAVATPSWAGNIQNAFGKAPDLAAATGPVLGRNGISVQWGPMAVDLRGRDRRMEDGAEPLPTGHVRKLHGTNMVFRRSLLEDIGGFDPAFSYYLDDTDMAVRCGSSGLNSAWLPDVIVHHGYAASAVRTEDRVPLSLFDIGASTSVFLRKHVPAAIHEAELEQLEADQRRRLFRLARKRRLDPAAIRRLMESLKAGVADGLDRAFGDVSFSSKDAPFAALRETPPGRHVILSGWRINAPNLRQQARRLVQEDHAVTLFLFEPTPRKHRVTFTDGGWWEQVGGLFGPTERTGPRLRFSTRKTRLRSEIARMRPQRCPGFGIE